MKLNAHDKIIERLRMLTYTGMLIVLMLTACGVDPYKDEYVLPTKFVKATPPGGDIAADSRITIIFDNPPKDIKVSTGTVGGSGKSAIIMGPFPLGPLELIITWADGTQVGTQVLNFNVNVRVNAKT